MTYNKLINFCRKNGYEIMRDPDGVCYLPNSKCNPKSKHFYWWYPQEDKDDINVSETIEDAFKDIIKNITIRKKDQG